MTSIPDVNQRAEVEQLRARVKELETTCQKLIDWLYRVRGEDENLVIDHAEDGFSLSEALDVVGDPEVQIPTP